MSTLEWLFAISGFTLASYSVVGNDVIQTLGTFLSSNSHRKWYHLWLYIGAIFLAVMLYAYFFKDGDVAYGKLNPEKYPFPSPMAWWYILPPLILLSITRIGIPVSTTFLILSLFSVGKMKQFTADGFLSNIFSWDSAILQMMLKSISGYFIAFGFGMLVYLAISKIFEKHILNNPLKKKELNLWITLQWLSTGLLWSQWLIQDMANIFVYMPARMGEGEYPMTLAIFLFGTIVPLVLLAYIFQRGGGAIQKIVTSKTNTTDIRAATVVDFSYAIVLLVFKYNLLGLFEDKIPMSTTWIFIGLLAGREFAINLVLKHRALPSTLKMLALDLGKASIGIIISILLVILIMFLH